MISKITFLDAATVDFGDLDLSVFSSMGDYRQFDITSPDEVVEKISDSDIIITNKVAVDKNILKQCPSLKLICLSATGYNIIDIEEARSRGVAVCNVAGYSTFSVAQQTVSFILALAGNLVRYNEASHDGTWSASKIFTLGTWPLIDVRGMTLGIMGYGDIGRAVAKIAEVLGMNILALERNGIAYKNENVKRVNLSDLQRMSDVISIHIPLTDYSNSLVDYEFFKAMNPSAFLINMARGPVVVQKDLAIALHEGLIKGAALDVLEKEPPDADDPILTAPNCIITPHIAWASRASRQRLVDEIIQNIEAFQKGEKRNRII